MPADAQQTDKIENAPALEDPPVDIVDPEDARKAEKKRRRAERRAAREKEKELRRATRR